MKATACRKRHFHQWVENCAGRSLHKTAVTIRVNSCPFVVKKRFSPRLGLNSRPNTRYTLDFYANDSADPSGHGEGQRHLGNKVVTTDGAGNAASLSITLLCSFRKGEVVTATATDRAGSTSEFFAAVRIR